MRSKKNIACTVARKQPHHHSQVIHHHHDLLQNETETPPIEGKDNCSLWLYLMMPKSSWLAYTIVILDRVISAYLQVEIHVDPLRHQNPKFTSPNTNFCGNCSFRKAKSTLRLGFPSKDCKRSSTLNVKWLFQCPQEIFTRCRPQANDQK